MSLVKDYKTEDTIYRTTCKCGAEIVWTANFSMPIDELRTLVKDKFNWTLFPSRCPECKGK